MHYSIESRDLSPQSILGMRELTTHAELSGTLAKLLPEVFGYAQQSGATMSGPPLAIYHDWQPPRVLVEGAIPVAQASPGNGRVQPGMLPGGTVAVTVHIGPYEKLMDAYMAIEAWMKANGKRAVGPAWEVYWTDPSQVSNPADYKTEVFWPIA